MMPELDQEPPLTPLETSQEEPESFAEPTPPSTAARSGVWDRSKVASNPFSSASGSGSLNRKVICFIQ